MKWLFGTTLAVALLPSITVGDDWKDESGKGRWGWDGDRWEWNGETPDWARGRGYWDGRYPPPFWSPPARVYFPPPVIEYRYGPRYGWSKDDWKEWEKREKELRKREKEAYKKWRKWYWGDDD